MKEIWLKIAEHEIGKDSSVTADILSAAKGVITVADVLKYFPEFATIDHFKQALCSSLVAVSRQIDEHQVRKMTLNIRWGTDGHFVRIRHGPCRMVHHRDGPHFICKQGILEIYCACKTAD